MAQAASVRAHQGGRSGFARGRPGRASEGAPFHAPDLAGTAPGTTAPATSSDVHLGARGRGARLKRKASYDAHAAGDYEGYYDADENWWDDHKWEDNQYGGYDVGMGYYDEYEALNEMEFFEIDLHSMVFTLDESLEPQDLYVGLEFEEKSMLFVLDDADIDEQSPAAWRSQPMKIHPEPQVRTERKDPASSAPPRRLEVSDAAALTPVAAGSAAAASAAAAGYTGQSASAAATGATTPALPLGLFPSAGGLATSPGAGLAGQQDATTAPVAATALPQPGSPARQASGDSVVADEPIQPQLQAVSSPGAPANSLRAPGQAAATAAQSPKIVISNSQLEHLKQKMQALKQRCLPAVQEEEPPAAAEEPPPAAAAAPAAAPQPARRLSHRASGSPPPPRCPGGHVLKIFLTPQDGWWCSVCKSPHPKNSAFSGCRKCDYDECENCTRKKRPGRRSSRDRGSSPRATRRGSSPSSLAGSPRRGVTSRRMASPEDEEEEEEDPTASASASPPRRRGEDQRRRGEGRHEESRRGYEEGSRRGLQRRKETRHGGSSRREASARAASGRHRSDDDASSQEEEQHRPAREVRRTKKDPRLVPREKRPVPAPERWDPRDRREAEDRPLAQQQSPPRKAAPHQRREADGAVGSTSRGEAAPRKRRDSDAGGAVREAGTRRRQAPPEDRHAPLPPSDEASGSEEPPPKKGRAANALAMSLADELPQRGVGSSGSRAVSLTRAARAPVSEPSSPSPAAEDSAGGGAPRRQRRWPRSSPETPGEEGSRPARRVTEAPARPARGQGNDFLQRVLRANAKQAKKGTGSGAAAKESPGDLSDGPGPGRSERIGGPPGIRKALVDFASQGDRKSRRV
uniref:Uncharacterized protein n=1 Tax=Alexandrium monilatum TaxID=311494 RepID=A0A7S4QXH7_9DINO